MHYIFVDSLNVYYVYDIIYIKKITLRLKWLFQYDISMEKFYKFILRTENRIKTVQNESEMKNQ